VSDYNVAVVGAGAVGVEMVRVLRQRSFPVRELRVLARSNREMDIDGVTCCVRETTPEAFDGIQIALFAGTEGEKGAAVTFAAEATKRGAVVIDNGNDFRMDPRVPLVVPEVNGEDVARHKGIIANPNCSTIQMVVALKPIHDAARLRRVIVSTYQAVSGAGGGAIRELAAETEARVQGAPRPAGQAFAKPIAFNALAHIGGFREDGTTSEEWKMVQETHKILHDDSIAVHATCVRIPVYNGHSESVYVETERKLTAEEARAIWGRAAGIVVIDAADPSDEDRYRRSYPTPQDADGADTTLIGRVREDPFIPNGLSFWCISDNLRKGAALNAVQIAEELVRRGMVNG
jgi:aspartate-semialdehyde dehydrogenase